MTLELNKTEEVEMNKESANLKPDWEPILFRVAGFFAIFNLPFLGVYKSLFTGNSHIDDIPVLITAVAFFGLSLFTAYLFKRVRFGWNRDGVYKQGMFRKTEIPWTHIEKIYDTGEIEGWTECDLLAIKKTGRRIFIIKSGKARIVLDQYSDVLEMKKDLAQRLNLVITDEYKFKWDLLVNG
jgi:hypothetical protein